VGETADEVRLLLFAPGVDAQSIDVDIQDNVLSIHGRRQSEPVDEDDGTYHRRERFSGEFTRVVSLPDTVDADTVEATLEYGVLDITAKKCAEVQPRRIEVQSGNKLEVA